ncbi:MAG: hypothetical protein ABI614_21795 [Planctomycetota bacterium]
MKSVLTCDDVFDALTREPFPTGGADDDFVESHLAVCHECRQLAEAFRPAVGLFHESLSAHGGDELPSYRGRLQPILVALSRQGAPHRDSPQRTHALCALAIAASLVVVGTAVLAALAAQPRSGDSVPGAAMVRAVQDRDYTMLAALEIPSNCRSMLESSGRAHRSEFVCCTKCHNATSRVASTNLAILKSSAACAACHNRMRDDVLSMVVPSGRGCELLLAYASIQNL